jgi:biopolymer transport protein ExbB
MRKLVVLGLALACACLASVAHANWNADWKQRVKITLNTGTDGAPLSSPVDGAPVLVRLHTGNFSFVDAKPDGSDLRFIAADDKTPLKFHIEKFDGLNELALLWVQVPHVAPGGKADPIWLYYGNTGAAVADDPKGTYDAAQALVYHFAERDGPPQDTTANANHATRFTAKPAAAGLIDGAATFDGDTELQLAASPSLKTGPNGLTVSLWIKPADVAEGTLYAGEGAGGLRVSLRDGKLVAQVRNTQVTSTAAVAAGTWQHVAIVAKDGLALYVNGQESGRATGPAPEQEGAAAVGRRYRGDLDELEISTTARSADWVRLAAQSQGPDQKLVTVLPPEGGGESGPSYIRILLGAVTLDGWVVIGILGLMFLLSVYVMAAKAVSVRAMARDNDRFKKQFESLLAGVSTSGAEEGPALEAETVAARKFRKSSLYRLYAAGTHELRSRFTAYAKAGREPTLSDQSINAIRATIDARLVREQQRINSQMVLLTICIAGGPFLGLLGTVVGVMITFAAIAAAGDVNVNSIAPGIAAALVATVAGLAVAIPSLFGYNYLTTKISELSSDMQVFIDEFVTRVAELHSV